jgi:hypothetical protein
VGDGRWCSYRSASHREKGCSPLASNPAKLVRKLVQVYAIGDEICAISEFNHTLGKKGYCVTIYVREPDEWKARHDLLEMIDGTLVFIEKLSCKRRSSRF